MLAADATDLRSAYLAVLVCLLVLCAHTCVGQVRRRYEAGSFAGQSLEPNHPVQAQATRLLASLGGSIEPSRTVRD